MVGPTDPDPFHLFFSPSIPEVSPAVGTPAPISLISPPNPLKPQPIHSFSFPLAPSSLHFYPSRSSWCFQSVAAPSLGIFLWIDLLEVRCLSFLLDLGLWKYFGHASSHSCLFLIPLPWFCFRRVSRCRFGGFR